MIKRTIFHTLAALGLVLVPLTAAHADHHMDNKGMMQKAVEHYVAISDALAQDSVDGVAEHAQALLDAMPAKMGDKAMHGEKGHAEHGDEGHAMHDEKGHAMHEGSMAEAHASMQAALKTLSGPDTGLEAARAAFTDLSATFVPMAQKHAAASGPNEDFVVVHCPMAPGNGDWIQAKGKTANPFHGSKMLRCGTQLGALGADATAKKMHGAEGKGSGDHGSKDHGEHGHDR